MRIGIDAHAIGAKSPQGGNETFWRNLLLKLGEIDGKNEYFIFTSGQSWLETQLCGCSNFHFQTISESASKRVFYEINYFSKHFRLDLFHGTYYGPLVNIIPMILTVHDASYFRMKELYPSLRYTLLRTLIKKSLRAARAIVTISNFSKEEIIQLTGITEEKVKVIHCGVDNFSISDESTSSNHPVTDEFSIDQNWKPYILFLGNIEPRKNLSTFIKAFSILQHRCDSRYKLIIAGMPHEGYIGYLVELVSQLKLNNKVIFTGYVPELKRQLIISGASLFVYPSLYEGFGFPPFEAFSLGVPVVVAQAGAMPEVLGDAAIFFHPLDYDDLADKMFELLTNQALRSDLVIKGYSQISKFSWLEAAKKLIRVYEEII